MHQRQGSQHITQLAALRALSSGKLPDHHAERVDVGLLRAALPQQQLGRGPGKGASDLPQLADIGLDSHSTHIKRGSCEAPLGRAWLCPYDKPCTCRQEAGAEDPPLYVW